MILGLTASWWYQAPNAEFIHNRGNLGKNLSTIKEYTTLYTWKTEKRMHLSALFCFPVSDARRPLGDFHLPAMQAAQRQQGSLFPEDKVQFKGRKCLTLEDEGEGFLQFQLRFLDPYLWLLFILTCFLECFGRGLYVSLYLTPESLWDQKKWSLWQGFLPGLQVEMRPQKCWRQGDLRPGGSHIWPIIPEEGFSVLLLHYWFNRLAGHELSGKWK